MTSWTLWLNGDQTTTGFSVPHGNYVVTPEIVLEAVVRRLDDDPKECERVKKTYYPYLADLTPTAKDVVTMSNVLGMVCREHDVGRVSEELGIAPGPTILVRFLDEIARDWLVIKFMYRDTPTDRSLVPYWILGRRKGVGYQYFPMPRGFVVEPDGSVLFDYEGHDTFDLGVFQLDLMLDRGKAIAIGLIAEALEKNPARPLRSLVCSPQPVKGHALQLHALFEELKYMLTEE